MVQILGAELAPHTGYQFRVLC